MKRNLLKKVMSLVVATSLMATMMVGCGSETEESAGVLNMYIWTEYVPESVIEGFEEETGIQVNVSYYSSNEDLYAKLKSEAEGTYDLIQPSDYMVEKLAAQGMVEEIDKDALTNFDNLSEAYLDPSYDPGNVYSIPFMGGLVAIAVNTSMITTEITSYDDIFDASLAGQAVVLDDSRAIIGLTAKSLGYSMSTTDAGELAEIEEKLLTLKDIIKVYDSDSPKSVLITGDCGLGLVWNAEVALAMEENEDIEIVFPEEGAYMFLDNWSIPTGAVNSEEALMFIDYILSAEASAACSEELPYLNPNDAAVALLGDDYLNNIAKNIPAEEIAKGEYIENLDTDTQAIYEAMWTELKK
ncbi:MAG: spermidine/putrescine ABC transporter substrate-binding protein [Lachnospiraceae bacterium]